MTKEELKETIENLDDEVVELIIDGCKELFFDGVQPCYWDRDSVLDRFDKITENFD